jgi:[protein-PII] uridylyltransferase
VAFLARDRLLDEPGLVGAELCRRLTASTDEWLTSIFADALATAGQPNGPVALVAVGGYGRGELAPWSDLDVLLLHDVRKGVGPLAEAMWYPIWDTRLKLGHAVRTVKEAVQLASGDLETATSFLDVRHLAGDRRLTDELAEQGLSLWRKRAKGWLEQLAGSVERRQVTAGETAFLLEPNLKDGKGGLRDVHSLRWAAAAGVTGVDVLLDGDRDALAPCYETLLAVRVELHRLMGKPGDVLALQDQDAVADQLGAGDADVLMASISSAARTISWISDESWFRVRDALAGGPRRAVRADVAVAAGVAVHDGQIHLVASAMPSTDPTLMLSVATAAARQRTLIDRATLDRLAAETPVWPEPWPAGASDDLVALLLEGHDAIGALEALDQRDLLTRLLPEWAPVRAKPQRNAYHRFTVDRHLWEAVANAAELAERVTRPDLLVLGALLHDLGKGYPGDHTDAGVELVAVIAPRMGLSPRDTAIVSQLVRHHLLLPEVATRRDLSDDATITAVADAVGDHLTLALLAALTEADSLATGSSAWSPWKAELVDELVRKVDMVLGGGDAVEVAARWRLFPSAEVETMMAAGVERIMTEADRVTVVSVDRPGLFSRVAGVLSLHGLGVIAAEAHSDDAGSGGAGMAANEFRVVVPGHGPVPWSKVTEDLEHALAGRLAIESRLAERARTYRRRRAQSAEPAQRWVRIDNDASSNATVIEVRAPDSVGVLYRITKSLAEVGLDIRHAKVATLGHEVVDTFYVQSAGTKVTDAFHLREIDLAVNHAIA